METKKPRVRKYLSIFVAFVAIALGAIAATNYALNPLIYSKGAQARAAEALMAGQNLKIADSNIDWRGLRREHIARMTQTPDVLVFGGSRWQEAVGDSLPGYTMYTSFAQNDHLEDMMALSEILHRHNRLPSTLVLSVRFATFEKLDKRVAWWWKTLAPEYLAMGQRLGVETRPWHEWFPREKWASLFSVELLTAKVQQYSAQKLLWEPTAALHDKEFDIAGVDGALRFSERRLKKENPEYAERTSIAKGKKDAKSRLTIDEKLVAQLPVLLKFLKDNGVTVVFAQTPFHPAYYEQIKGSQYHADLTKIENELVNVATAQGLQVIGSFDAVAVGCAPNQFRDFNHGDSDCLKKILSQIKLKPKTAAPSATKSL